MVGIEVLKKDLTTVANLIKKIDVALEDDKISFTEAIGLAFQIPDVFKIVKTYKDAVGELKDLTQAEAEELSVHFAGEFDLTNDKAEEMVEQILSVIVAIAGAFLKTEELPE